jgi:hypothetical protein
MALPKSYAVGKNLPLIGGQGTPPVPALGALTLSATAFLVGTPTNGTINGATAGSAIAPGVLPAGLTINGAARTWSWDGSGAVTAGNITLTETLAGATGSPWPSVIAFAVTNAPAKPDHGPSDWFYDSAIGFAAAAADTPLRNIAPWQAINRSGSTNAERNDAVIYQPEAYVHNNSKANNGTSINNFDPNSVGLFLFGIDTGSTRHVFEADVFSNSQHYLSVNAVHNGNRTAYQTNGGGGGAFDWTGAAGSEVRTARTTTYFPTYSSATARFIEGRGIQSQPSVGSKVRLRAFDGEVAVSIGSAPFERFNNTNTGTFVGMSSASNNFRGYKNFKVGVPKTDLKINPAKLWYNRIKGWQGLAGGGRRITRTGTWAGKRPTGMLWSLVRPTDDTVIKDWDGVPFAQTVITRTTGTDADGTGTWSISIDVEWKLDGVNPYRLRVAPRDTSVATNLDTRDIDRVSEIGHFYVCVGFVMAGQSEIAGANSTVVGTGFPDHAGGCFYGIADVANPPYVEQPYAANTPWARDTIDENNLRDRQSAWFTSHLSRAYGGPVSCAFVALGARLSENLGPNNVTNNDWNNIQAHLGYIGAFEHLVIGQGSAESWAGGAASWTTNWAVNISAYFAFANQPVSHIPYTFLVPTGFANIPGQASSAAQDGNSNNIRAQQLAFPAYMAGRPTPYNVVYACSFTDLVVDAGGEFTDAIRSGGEGLRRVGMTIAKTLNQTGSGLGVISGVGPFVTAVQKISNTLLRVTHNLNGSTGLSGTNLSGHRVFSDAAGTVPVTITGAVNVINATQIDIPIANTPGQVWWCDWWNANPLQSPRAVGAYAAISDGTPSAGALSLPTMFTPVPTLAA